VNLRRGSFASESGEFQTPLAAHFTLNTTMEHPMKYSSFLLAMLMLGCAGTRFASNPDGKWTGKMQGPNGDADITFTFRVSGDTLSGSVGGPMGDLPISNGKVKKDTFTFDVSMGELVISHLCTHDGDTVTMKVNGFGGEPMEMVLKRTVDAK
jgi:hypothetical protein